MARNPDEFGGLRGKSRAPLRNAMRIAETRQRISITQIVDRLTKHMLGEIEMSVTQLRAAEILLKKVLPDLHESNSHTTVDQRVTVEDSRADRERARQIIEDAIAQASAGAETCH
jgi:hypothetical protein